MHCVNNMKDFNPKNYTIQDYIRVDGILYCITNNKKCDFDELMLIEVGVN